MSNLKPKPMTLFYQTNTWTSQPQITEETKKIWEHIVQKKNWRIVQLPNGFYQTEYLDPKKEDSWIDVTRRETMEGAESAIDASINHYEKKLAHIRGPQVVKTFK
jgi:hypothetical protein|tara:strand:- start:2428 stop:2742 length:315 start_codon:yes stop_codon:yes gene_type:complete